MDRLAFQEWPAVLRRRWILTGAAGVVFLLVGLAVFFALGDRILLILSGMLTLCTLLHCVEYYHTIRCRRYQAIEAICVDLGRPGIGRRRKIRLLLQEGGEITVTLDKRMDLRIGHQYRIFCRLDRTPPHGGADLQCLPAGDSILALEDLGESRADFAIEDKEEPKHDL